MSTTTAHINNKPSLRASHCEDKERSKLKQSQPLVPALRFNEFEGVWSKEKAGELCDCIVPGRNKPKQFDGNIAWITTPDIVHSSYIFNSKSGLGISKEEAKSVGSKIAPKNSVIISCVGDLGLVAIAGAELVINQQLHAFLPSEKVEYRFLMYSITTQGRYIDRVATKTAVPYMNKNNCNSIPVYLPNYPEQQKIASFLSAVDEKIQQLTKKAALLEQYKKGVMQQLFSGKLRFKPTVIARNEAISQNETEYSDWEEKRLGEYLVHKSTRNKDLSVGLVLSVSNKKGFISQEEQFHGYEVASKDVSNYKIVDKDDIAYNPSRINVGSIARLINFEQGIVSPMYVIFSLKNGLNKIFFENLYNTHRFKHLIKVGCSGSVRDSLNFDDLCDFEFKFPSIEEQQKIASYLSSIDTKIEAVHHQITQTQTFKKGLLQQMFV